MALKEIDIYGHERIHASFGKKYYTKIGDTLRAAKLEKIQFLPAVHTYEWAYICTFRVAGLGVQEEKTLLSGLGRLNVTHLALYDSVEDYSNGVLTKDRSEYDRGAVLKYAFGDFATIRKSTDSEHRRSVIRWRWSGTKAQALCLSGSIYLDATHWYTDAEIPQNTYATKEECERDNQISVIEFDE